jgi:hypothetical protein
MEYGGDTVGSGPSLSGAPSENDSIAHPATLPIQSNMKREQNAVLWRFIDATCRRIH